MNRVWIFLAGGFSGLLVGALIYACPVPAKSLADEALEEVRQEDQIRELRALRHEREDREIFVYPKPPCQP